MPRCFVTATIVRAFAHCVLLGVKYCWWPYTPAGSRLDSDRFAYGSGFGAAVVAFVVAVGFALVLGFAAVVFGAALGLVRGAGIEALRADGPALPSCFAGTRPFSNALADADEDADRLGLRPRRPEAA